MGRLSGLIVGVLRNSKHDRERTSKASLTFLTTLKSIRDGHMVFTLSLPSLPRKVLRTKDNSDPLLFCPTFIECGWQSGKVKSDNGRSNSTMADSPHRRH
eukprot:7142900-Heterocapsa_arctica.AAC.1